MLDIKQEKDTALAGLTGAEYLALQELNQFKWGKQFPPLILALISYTDWLGRRYRDCMTIGLYDQGENYG
jgi:hypothetical protein